MYNPFSLEGKTIVVTGASSGIGRQCAIDCSKMGANVVLVARNESRLKETLALMEAGSHYIVVEDLTCFSDIPLFVKNIVDNAGELDGLVNCAGISTTKPLKTTSAEELEDYYKANVVAGVMISKEICKLGNYRKNGCSIIFIASVAGVVGESMKVSYSLSKAALIGGVRSLACEYAKKKIRYNCISPGVIETPINMNQPYMQNPEYRKIFESKHLLGFGQCSDISNACIFLLSDASRWITGQNLIVDGGYTVQ